jgi:DNA mismatch repair protein MutS
MDDLTPMMQQYFTIKEQHKDCILLYRLGDFYEMFFDDAKVASSVLDLVLTSRGKNKNGAETPLCGFPFHAAENYIGRLVKAGYKVAICEQTEDPAAAKGIVKRDVIRVVTAGTYVDDTEVASRYLLALTFGKKRIGIAFLDASGGTVFAASYANESDAHAAVSKLPVYECVHAITDTDKAKTFFDAPLLRLKKIALSSHDDWTFSADIAKRSLLAHFGTQSLSGFGFADDETDAAAAAGALLDYAKKVNKHEMRHVDRLALYDDSAYAYISPAACYGLELETLIGVIDKTVTPLGRRAFRQRVFNPLKNIETIEQRLDAVAAFKDDERLCENIREQLKNTPDVEKALSRISSGGNSARDLLALRSTLNKVPGLLSSLGTHAAADGLLPLSDIAGLRILLDNAIDPETPLTNNEGKVIKHGFDSELDALRAIQTNAKQWLSDYQVREKTRSGIASLKVGFNSVFGYYIEISKANLASVPSDYIRKQTLVNGERFITQELKEFEEKMLSADANVAKIEKRLLDGICTHIMAKSGEIHTLADALAEIDVTASLAVLALMQGYVRPVINDSLRIDIKDGRHPIVEASLTDGAFIPNDTLLDAADHHLVILTGPNMAGKSTYIRQTATLVIMAQMGSFIPASSAVIGFADKIYTRIGAHDEITKGQSTFMVEMSETAEIMNNMTDRSLVILDEIGRGTSTYDGLALAWALAEHLREKHVRALFATHFHELLALAEPANGVKNYNVSVKEWKDEIVFLHKIVPGGTDESYGIYVAKLAGIPRSVVSRAKDVLTRLEVHGNLHEKILGTGKSKPKDSAQLSLFAAEVDTRYDELKGTIEALDMNDMTPVEALVFLDGLKKRLKDGT